MAFQPGFPVQCSEDVSMEPDGNRYQAYQTSVEVPGSGSATDLSSQLEMDADVVSGQAAGAARGPSVTLTGQQQTSASAGGKQRDTIKIEGHGCTIHAEGLAAALKPGGVFQLGGHNEMTIYKNEGSGDGSYKSRKNKYPLTDNQQPPKYEHLDIVSSKLGGDWRRLGRQMNLDDATLDQIRQDFHVEGQREVNYRMLKKWMQLCSGQCTLALLAKLLAQVGRGDIADELRNG